MRSSLKLRHLFPLFLVMLCALPALADVPSPERDRRRAEGRSWRQRFPNQSPPDLNVTPAPDGESLMLDIACKGPCMYSYTLNRGRGEDEERGEGEIDELGGGKRGERLALAPAKEKEEHWRLKVYYTLYGVEPTRFGPKRTDDTLTGCALWRFFTGPGDKGEPRLQQEELDGGDYFELRGCNQ